VPALVAGRVSSGQHRATVHATSTGNVNFVNDPSAPEIATDRGRIRGLRRSSVRRFLGIPYAASPEGDLRFRPPVPHRGWSGVLEATSLPQPPPQLSAFGAERTGSEDCLRLNVTTPLDAEGCAVFVWLHGGGFVGGKAEEDDTRPEALCRRNIIVVSVGYRLGALGWLRLREHDPSLSDGNVGLLDQVAALHWIQRNIAAFGGDPARVTVVGQSAGAMSIAALLAVPSASGTFRSAILQSGVATAVTTTDPDDAGELCERVVRAAEVAHPLDLLSCPVERLLEAQRTAIGGSHRRDASNPRRVSFLPFAPVTGTDTLPVNPFTAVRRGAAEPVPLIVGANLDEMRSLAPGGISEAEGRAWVDALDPPSPGDLWSAYERRVGTSPDLIVSAMKTDLFFRLPALHFARAVAAGGTPVWHYDFRWPSSFPGFGAAHRIELRFVFDLLGESGARLSHGDAPQHLAAAISGAWTAMVADGRPIADGADERPWCEYNATQQTRVFDAEIHDEHDFGADLEELWGDSLMLEA
jgi:para-nitrobenzyl esterase